MAATIVIILLVLIIIFAAVILIRTGAYLHQAEPVEPAELPDVDAQTVAERLSAAVRYETVSAWIDQPADPLELLKLQRELQRSYPLTHATLQREFVSDYGLLYIWTGVQPELPPVMLCAHLDVAPVDPQTIDHWGHSPFSGEEEAGYLYGRGALDDKVQVVTIFEAVEALLQTGFQPQRTVYLGFGEDEEIGGFRGAARIAAWLEERGEHLEALLDEGGALVHGVLPGVDDPVALVGISEKGYLTLRLIVEDASGHSSAPLPSSTIGVLAGAIQRLESNPLPARLELIRATYKTIGAAASPWLQLLFANTWLFGGLLRRRLEASPQTNAAIRTTTAVTMIKGGVKDNILPPKAEAAVNLRLMPGDSIASVCEAVYRVIADERVRVEVPDNAGWEPLPISDTGRRAYISLSNAIRQVYPQAVVAPYLTMATTDARHYTPICEHIFRFTPYELDREELARIHGFNERIPIETLARMVQFYYLLLQDWAS